MTSMKKKPKSMMYCSLHAVDEPSWYCQWISWTGATEQLLGDVVGAAVADAAGGDVRPPLPEFGSSRQGEPIDSKDTMPFRVIHQPRSTTTINIREQALC
jgi:hypothetical protein